MTPSKWLYYGSDDDTSLSLEFTTLNPCQLVRVAGEGEVVRKQDSVLGDYRSVYINVLDISQIRVSPSKDIQTNRMIALSHRVVVGMWSEGRPVFKKINGWSRFLLLHEDSNAWTIRPSTFADGVHVQSGRATNSPALPEAGPRVGSEVTKWRYWDSVWREGDISVTCHEDLCPPLPPTLGQTCDASFGTLDCHYDQDQDHCCCGKCPDRFTMSCARDPSTGVGLWQPTFCPAGACATEGELQ